jgi:SsrA-binding protein
MSRLADNKKALFDYEVLDKFEAGLVLTGQEVKSARVGRLSLRGSHVGLAQGGLWLINASLPPYDKAGHLVDYDPNRSRKLLVHKREIDKLVGKLEQKGLTLVPISAYTKGSKIKLEFALARGRKKYEKREAIKKRDIDREVRRSLGE